LPEVVREKTFWAEVVRAKGGFWTDVEREMPERREVNAGGASAGAVDLIGS
jgi:hypothetical protein